MLVWHFDNKIFQECVCYYWNCLENKWADRSIRSIHTIHTHLHILEWRWMRLNSGLGHRIHFVTLLNSKRIYYTDLSQVDATKWTSLERFSTHTRSHTFSIPHFNFAYFILSSRSLALFHSVLPIRFAFTPSSQKFFCVCVRLCLLFHIHTQREQKVNI